MKRKRLLALTLALCILAIPILASCDSSDVIDAINSLNKDDIDSIISDVKSTYDDIKDEQSQTMPSSSDKEPGNNGNGNGHGTGGNSGSDNNDNSGNGNGNNGGGNGNGGSTTPEEKPAPIEIVDSELGLVFTLSEDESYYSVSAHKASQKRRIVIPSVYEGLPVYEIAPNAFSGCVILESIVIPNSIVTLGGFAFFRCESLKTICIPISVQTVGAYSFDGCSVLSIFCEASKKPKGWNNKWNPDDRPVEWGYTCEHQWQGATCTEPSICMICGAIDGEALGHSWTEVSCTEPKYCMVCEIVDVEATGHKWIEPTCTEKGYCEACMEQGEEALGHEIKDGKCTRCEYEEEEEKEEEIIVPNGTNVAPLASATDSDNWWAADPSYLIDGDRTTASLSGIHTHTPYFELEWSKYYSFTDLIFIMNGKGSAAHAGMFFNTPTSDEYEYDVILYGENGEVVFEALGLQASGENRYSHFELENVVACRLKLVIHGMYQYHPIFEIEAYGEEIGCNHHWIDATCERPRTCIRCGITEGGKTSHQQNGEPSCVELAICKYCSQPFGNYGSHVWENDTCTVCSVKKETLGIDEIEAILPSEIGPGTGNLDKLFDGDKTTNGIYGNGQNEYYPNKSGDYLIITLKNETQISGVILWTCGNWSYGKLELFDADGNKVHEERVIYNSITLIETGESTPVEINLGHIGVKVKTVKLIAEAVKWEQGSTFKTSEIELLRGDHQWQEATCQAPKTCVVCGATEGGTGNHNWQAATCQAPKTCSVCGITVGDVGNEHNMTEATCTAASRCTLCGIVEGGPLGHNMENRSCTEPATCERCGYKTGVAYGHIFLDGICCLCYAEDEIIVSYNNLSGREITKAAMNSDGSYTLLENKLSNGNPAIDLGNGTVLEKEFYGWFDEEGNLYAPGERVTFSKTTRLYEAYGVTVFNANDLISCVQKNSMNNSTYIKLGADIVLNRQVSCNWSTAIIDLNGYVLTSTVNDAAFHIYRGAFIMLGEGVFVHAPANVNTSNISVGTVRFQRHGYGDQENPQLFRIGKGVKFETPYNALMVHSVLTEKMPNIVIAGELIAKSIAYIVPATDRALCRITEDAVINLEIDYIIFEENTTEGTRLYFVFEKDVEINEGTTVNGVYKVFVQDGIFYERII